MYFNGLWLETKYLATYYFYRGLYGETQVWYLFKETLQMFIIRVGRKLVMSFVKSNSRHQIADRESPRSENFTRTTFASQKNFRQQHAILIESPIPGRLIRRARAKYMQLLHKKFPYLIIQSEKRKTFRCRRKHLIFGKTYTQGIIVTLRF